MARVPAQCPQGFTRYTVVRGDTMYLIAQRLRVDIGLLIANNPHIPNPAILFPGDILCVPIPVILPCCTVLKPLIPPVSVSAVGVALAQQLSAGEQAVSIIATGLPNPSQLGNYNVYEGFITISGIGAFGFVLYPTPETPPTWSGKVTLTRPILYRGATIQVRTSNTTTEVPPIVVLQGLLCT